jgi:uncharacterized protein
MNKRDFLKLSSAALAASLVPAVAKSNSKTEFSKKAFFGKKPITRTLGKTGIKVPVVSSGSIPLDNPALIKKIFESGIKHFDSAWDYQNGRVDSTIGEMLKIYGRDKYIISTKILLPMDEKAGQYTKDSTTKAFMDQLEVSMKRLGVDYVDILYLHKPPTRAAAFNEEMMNGLRKAKEQGKARFVGLSSHSNQVELLDAAIESKFYDVALVGYNFRQDQIVKPAVARANAAGIGVVAMKVFAGEYEDKSRNKPINKTAALKWVLQDENLHTAILTIHTFEELNSYLPQMYDIKMTQQEKSDLAEAYQSSGMYCLGCENCLKQCPEHLPIPDLMRAYMYTYGYRDPAKGQKVLNYLKLASDPCSNCSSCAVKCSKGFDVAEKINDIIRLKNVPQEFIA